MTRMVLFWKVGGLCLVLMDAKVKRLGSGFDPDPIALLLLFRFDRTLRF